jgi:hypothetical protein
LADAVWHLRLDVSVSQPHPSTGNLTSAQPTVFAFPVYHERESDRLVSVIKGRNDVHHATAFFTGNLTFVD